MSPEVLRQHDPSQELVDNNAERNLELVDNTEGQASKELTPDQATDQANALAKEVDKLIAKHDRFQSLVDRAEDRVLAQYDALGIDPPQNVLDKIDADSKKTMGRIRQEAAKAIVDWDIKLDDFSNQGGDVFELSEALSELVDITGVERIVKPVENFEETTPEASNDNVEVVSTQKRPDVFTQTLDGIADDLDTMEMLGRDVEARREVIKNQLIEQLVDSVGDRSRLTKSVDTLQGNLLDVTNAVKKFESLRDSDQIDLSPDEIIDIRNKVIDKIGEDSLSASGIVESDLLSKEQANTMVKNIVGELQKIA